MKYRLHVGERVSFVSYGGSRFEMTGVVTEDDRHDRWPYTVLGDDGHTYVCAEHEIVSAGPHQRVDAGPTWGVPAPGGKHG